MTAASPAPVDLADAEAVGLALADIAEEAGRLILPLWKSGIQVDRKSDESPVTEADRRAETLILQRLSERFPGIPVISEEDAAESGTPDRIAARFFLVDPLDGTKAFVRGDPNFTVNIALVESGVPVAGAVVAPPTGETWRTGRSGAVKRTRSGPEAPARVRPWPAGGGVCLISHTMKPDEMESLRARYGFAGTQAMDSSIKLCRIAEGSADIYPRHGPTMEWDIAAAHAVLLGAGGALATPEGEPFLYGKADAGFRNGWFVARGGPAA